MTASSVNTAHATKVITYKRTTKTEKLKLIREGSVLRIFV